MTGKTQPVAALGNGGAPRPRVTLDIALREYGIYVVLVVLVAVFSLVAPGFASLNNMILILLQVSVMGILSIAMLFVILARGIDLSVGSILAIAGMFSGLAARQDPTIVTVAMAFGLPILIGILCGLFNGYLASWGGLPPLIVTLGTMYAYRGFIVWYHVDPVYRLQDWYRVLGQERIGPIPIPVIILLVVVAAASLVLNRTPFGRQVYAVGGNEEAARASGINVNLVKLAVYTISGALCGLAGLVFTSQLGAAQSISGMGFELIAIASVVVGGASLFGGRGTVGKTLVGALIMQIVQSALVMLEVPSPIQQATLGLIIIGAVFIDLRVQNQRAGRRVASIRRLFGIGFEVTRGSGNMKSWKYLAGMLSVAGGLALGAIAPVQAASVDVTKDGWWLTPYKASKPWTIGVSYTDVSISYIAALQRAVQAKAKEMGVKIIEVDARNDTNVELANVENLLQQDIDLLLLEGASLKASVASIEAANKANVPVVHFNILAEGGDYVTFVGSNQLESGQLMGQKIVELYKSAGKDKLKGIYMRGIAGYITDEVRSQGVKGVLEAAGIAGNIEWTEQYADFSRAKAQSVAKSILAKSSDYDFIIANGDDMILGALGAVKAAGLSGKIHVLSSVDGLPETLDGIKDGDIDSTVFQNAEGQGEGGILAATMFLDGVKDLPKEILVPFVLTDKSNIDQIMEIADRVYGK